MSAPEEKAYTREEDRQRQARLDVSTHGYRNFPGYWRTTGLWSTFLAFLGAAILVMIVIVNLNF